MKSWQPRARMAVIAVASFVLLVTVLPQIASGFGFTSLANRIVGSESCVGSVAVRDGEPGVVVIIAVEAAAGGGVVAGDRTL